MNRLDIGKLPTSPHDTKIIGRNHKSCTELLFNDFKLEGSLALKLIRIAIVLWHPFPRVQDYESGRGLLIFCVASFR